MKKYSLIEKKENISSFLLKNSLYFVSNKKIYSNVNNNFVNINSNNIYSVENLILSDTEKVYDFNLENYQIFINDDFQYRRRYYKNIVIFNNETNIFFYDIAKNQLVRKMNLNSFTIYGTIYCFINEYAIILGNDTTISAFDYIQEKILWQYDLETYFHQPAQIMEGRVLVSNNKVIFFAHTEDWSNFATFVLDAQTGQVLNNPKETIFGGKMYLFDGFLWQKKDKGFAKMNPETFEITHYDLTKDLPTEIIDNRTMAYHNGIIAVSAKPERDSIRSLVLLFDTNTGKIIWRKEILHNESKPSNKENRRQIEEIQMNDKYLAVSTTGFSLYIFEKQDIESK